LLFLLSLSPFFVSFEAGLADLDGLKLAAGAGVIGLFAEAGGVCAGRCFTTGVGRGAAEVAGEDFATVAFGNGFATGVARGETESAGGGDGG
jgi:hypothetical protein